MQAVLEHTTAALYAGGKTLANGCLVTCLHHQAVPRRIKCNFQHIMLLLLDGRHLALGHVGNFGAAWVRVRRVAGAGPCASKAACECMPTGVYSRPTLWLGGMSFHKSQGSETAVDPTTTVAAATALHYTSQRRSAVAGAHPW